MTTQAQVPTSQIAAGKRPAKMAPNQSLNHLLSFTLPPRQTHQYQGAPRRRRPNTHAVAWNKERFINAQYRFLMNPSGDYTVHFADPDIFFQWHDILQVIIPRASALISAAVSGDNAAHTEVSTTCPICLSPPIAPRMTKCGHVFCFPCVLHLLSTSDNLKWVRCPICFDSVNERQLKAVKWFDEVPVSHEDEDTPPGASSSSTAVDNGLMSTPKPGSSLRMRLMQRPQITTLSLPRSTTWPSDLIAPHQAPFHFLPDVYEFSKFMLATPTALISDLTRELDDLATERRSLASMKDDLGVSFVDAADAKVRQQMAKASALETPQLREVVDAAYHSLHKLKERLSYHVQREKEAEVQNGPEDDIPGEFLAQRQSAFTIPINPSPQPASTPSQPRRDPTPTKNPRHRRNLNPPPPSNSTYYYYQAASGMPIFLHPLDIKILLSHFNSYAEFPDDITVRVESYTESTVNEDLRKRCKYLAHVPEGADVIFIETDLQGVVGAEGLKNFERALTMRRQRRREKVRKDDKARARAEEREKERIVHNWNELTRRDVNAYIPLPAREPSPVDFNDFPEPGHEPSAQLTQSQQAPGAWGARSFATAAQHPSQSGRTIHPRPAARREPAREEDGWDLDVAFHELEQHSGRGGGRRKNNKMVVLGGGGGRKR